MKAVRLIESKTDSFMLTTTTRTVVISVTIIQQSAERSITAQISDSIGARTRTTTICLSDPIQNQSQRPNLSHGVYTTTLGRTSIGRAESRSITMNRNCS